MSNPVLVEILRGAVVESRHRGAVSVIDADGAEIFSVGDVDQPVFPRSAIKLIQALPLIESGAADALGFGNRELSLACASHNGEQEHVELAKSMLARAGLDEAALECGTHWPYDQPIAIALAKSGGAPGPCHNNCSGKHAGFLCTAMHLGDDPAGYVGAAHPAQRRVRDAMAEVTGAAHAAEACGTDGCSIPTYAIPLDAMARGFARMATGRGLDAGRAKAARRLMSACMAEPFFMAGTNRFCTEIMQAAPGRVFAKVGAEGVFCAAIPELGFGIALKIDDGASRAAEIAVAGVIARVARSVPEIAEPIGALARKIDRNWNGITVGERRFAALN
ncbi:MAG: asparaginase [Rhizobiaceae bacterium]|nr:asparaginase [Rhizobiaceae bacterium]